MTYIVVNQGSVIMVKILCIIKSIARNETLAIILRSSSVLYRQGHPEDCLVLGLVTQLIYGMMQGSGKSAFRCHPYAWAHTGDISVGWVS